MAPSYFCESVIDRSNGVRQNAMNLKNANSWKWSYKKKWWILDVLHTTDWLHQCHMSHVQATEQVRPHMVS